MKTMKLILTVVLALTMCLSFAACSDEPATTGDAELDQAIDDAVDEAFDETPVEDEEEEPAQEPEEEEEDYGEEEEPEDEGEGQVNVDTSAFDHLAGTLTDCYMGMTSAGEGVYMAFSSDQSYGVIAFLDPETSQSASFVGALEIISESEFRVTDERNGLALTFGVTPVSEEIYSVDMGGELPECAVEACGVEDIIQALAVIDTYSQAVA